MRVDNLTRPSQAAKTTALAYLIFKPIYAYGKDKDKKKARKGNDDNHQIGR